MTSRHNVRASFHRNLVTKPTNLWRHAKNKIYILTNGVLLSGGNRGST